MSNAVQSLVQSRIPPGGVENFWTTVVASYATGWRGHGIDASGAGPGMYYVAAMVLALAKAGFMCMGNCTRSSHVHAQAPCPKILSSLGGAARRCFSGLCIPGGVDWKTFLPRCMRNCT